MKPLAILLLALPALAQTVTKCDHYGQVTNCYAVPAPRPTLYRWSVAAVVSASAADAATSWGLREGNPVLGTRFDGRAVSIKAGMLTGSLLMQRWAMTRHPAMRRVFTWINFGEAGVLGGIAAHNARLR